MDVWTRKHGHELWNMTETWQTFFFKGIALTYSKTSYILYLILQLKILFLFGNALVFEPKVIKHKELSNNYFRVLILENKFNSDIKELKPISLLIFWWKKFCKNYNEVFLFQSIYFLTQKTEDIKIFCLIYWFCYLCFNYLKSILKIYSNGEKKNTSNWNQPSLLISVSFCKKENEDFKNPIGDSKEKKAIFKQP